MNNEQWTKMNKRIGVHNRRILTSECCEQQVETESGGILIQIQFTTSEYNNDNKNFHFAVLSYPKNFDIRRHIKYKYLKTILQQLLETRY